MLKDIRRKVMQIANRLVGQGQIRRNAMLTASMQGETLNGFINRAINEAMKNDKEDK